MTEIARLNDGSNCMELYCRSWSFEYSMASSAKQSLLSSEYPTVGLRNYDRQYKLNTLGDFEEDLRMWKKFFWTTNWFLPEFPLFTVVAELIWRDIRDDLVAASHDQDN